MQTFQQIREAKSPKGEVVFDKKIQKVPVKIVKDKKGFTAYVDGDMLDTFRNQKEAQKAAETIIKVLR